MRILFVCTGNTCRSPMAAALMRRLLAENELNDIEVLSAGLAATNEPASRHAIEAVAEYGLDITNHRSHSVTRDLWESADVIAVMGESHANMLTALGADPARILVLGISDPYGGNLDQYRQARDQIAEALKIKVLPRVTGGLPS